MEHKVWCGALDKLIDRCIELYDLCACSCPQMEIYTLTVATGTSEYSGTNNYIFVTLVGEKGESERTLLDNPGLDFCRGAVMCDLEILKLSPLYLAEFIRFTCIFISLSHPLLFVHSFVQFQKKF